MENINVSFFSGAMTINNACILMCLISSPFFYIVRKDHCFLINTYFKVIILLILLVITQLITKWMGH